MEKDLMLAEEIRTLFECKTVDIRTYSPLTLAYIGDAVYDLIIRTVIVEMGNRPANALHGMVIRYVNAGTQASMIEELQSVLTEEETAVYHRGRNAKSHTMAKNATADDYRKATGMEALIGYLYLQGRLERCLQLVKTGIAKLHMEP